MPSFSDLKQARGSWIAKVASPVLQRKFDCDVVPVMRRLPGDPQWQWGKDEVWFRTNSEMRPDRWWMDSRQSVFRKLLEQGCPVYIRKQTPATEGSPTGSVDTPMGVFSTANVVVSEDELTLQFIKKLLG